MSTSLLATRVLAWWARWPLINPAWDAASVTHEMRRCACPPTTEAVAAALRDLVIAGELVATVTGYRMSEKRWAAVKGEKEAV